MSQTKRKVLVVDDELDTAQTLWLILESSGFRVDIFTDPKEALGTFIPAYYDLAVIDVRMPDMNGFELYSDIKSLDYKINVLFLTALTVLNDYNDFKSKVSPRLHQRHFVQKPVEKDQFLDEVYFILFWTRLIFSVPNKRIYHSTDYLFPVKELLGWWKV